MKVVCIGLNHSGVTVVKTLAQRCSSAKIVGYERDEHLAFLSCGIALWIKKAVKSFDQLLQTDPQELRNEGIEPNVNHEVVRIDAKNHKVTVKNLLTGKVFDDHYDKLVVSSGSQPFLPPFPGFELEGVFAAKSFKTAENVKKYLADSRVKRVAVIGTGYVGIEFAEAFRDNGKEVMMFDMAPRVMSNYFEPEFTQLVEKEIKKRGISLHLGEKILSFQGKEGSVAKLTTDCGTHDVDMVVCCLGSRPNTKLLKGIVDLCPSGYVQVNQYLQTSDPDIYACGDCINVYDNSCQLTASIGLASNSVRTGLVAALNIANNNKHVFSGVQRTSAVCVFGWNLMSTGVNSALANRLKLPYQTTYFEDDSKPVFMPSEKVKIKLFWNKNNRKIIGCQIASRENHSEAIYFFSLAVMKGLTIDELPMVDLFFLPHFNKPDNFITQVGLRALGIHLEGV